MTRRRIVIVTWDPAARDDFWLTAHYFPAIVDFDLTRFPAIATLTRHLPDVSVEPLWVPRECEDGFLGAFWCRPEAYLVPAVRQAISGFARLAPGVADAGSPVWPRISGRAAGTRGSAQPRRRRPPISATGW